MVAQGPDMQELLEPHPAVRHWMARVALTTEPHYDVVSELLRKAAKRFRGDKEMTQVAKKCKL